MESCTVKDEFCLIESRQKISSTSSDSDETHGSQMNILEDQQEIEEAEACKPSLREMESSVASLSDDCIEKSESIGDGMNSPVETTGVDITTFAPDKDVDNVEVAEPILIKNRRALPLLGSSNIVSTIWEAGPLTPSFKTAVGCVSHDLTVHVDTTSLVHFPFTHAAGKQINRCPIKKKFFSCTNLINKEYFDESRRLKKTFTAHQTRMHPDNCHIPSEEDKRTFCSAKNKKNGSLHLSQKYDLKQVAACLSKLRLKIDLPLSRYRSLSDLFIMEAKYLEQPYLHGFQRTVVLHSHVTTGKKSDIYYNPAQDKIKLCSPQDVNKYFVDHPNLAPKLSSRNFDFYGAQHNVGLPYEVVRPSSLETNGMQRQALKVGVPVDESGFAGLIDNSNSEVDLLDFPMMESISSNKFLLDNFKVAQEEAEDTATAEANDSKFLLNNCKAAQEEAEDTATTEANDTNKINEAFSQKSQLPMDKGSPDLTKQCFGTMFTVQEKEMARQFQSMKRKSAILTELLSETAPKKMKTNREMTTLSQKGYISVDFLQPSSPIERSKALFGCTITPEEENTSENVVPHSVSLAEQQFESARIELDNVQRLLKENDEQRQSLKRKSAILTELLAEIAPKKMKTNSEMTTVSHRGYISVGLIQPLSQIETSKALFECTITPEKQNTSENAVPHSITLAEEQVVEACTELDNGGCHNVLRSCETPFRPLVYETILGVPLSSDISKEEEEVVDLLNLTTSPSIYSEPVRENVSYSEQPDDERRLLEHHDYALKRRDYYLPHNVKDEPFVEEDQDCVSSCDPAHHSTSCPLSPLPPSQMAGAPGPYASFRLLVPAGGHEHRPTQSDATSFCPESEPISFGEQSPVSNTSENEGDEIDILNLTISSSKYNKEIRGNVSYSEQSDDEHTLLEHHNYALKRKDYYLPHNVKDEPFVEEGQDCVSTCDPAHHWTSCPLSPLPPSQMVGVKAPDASFRPLVPAGGHEHRPTQSDATSSCSESESISFGEESPVSNISEDEEEEIYLQNLTTSTSIYSEEIRGNVSYSEESDDGSTLLEHHDYARKQKYYYLLHNVEDEPSVEEDQGCFSSCDPAHHWTSCSLSPCQMVGAPGPDASFRPLIPAGGDEHRSTQSDATPFCSESECGSSGGKFPVSNISENEEEEIDILNLTTSSSKYGEAIIGNVSYSEHSDDERTLLEHHDYPLKQKDHYLPHNVKDEPSVEENQNCVSSCDAANCWTSCSLSPLPPSQMVGVPAPDASFRLLVSVDGHEHRPTQSDGTSSCSEPEPISFGEQSPVSNISENEEEEIDILNLSTSSSKYSEAIRGNVSYSEQSDDERTLLEHHDYPLKQKDYYLPHKMKDEISVEEDQDSVSSCDAAHRLTSCPLSPLPPSQMVGVPAPDASCRLLVPVVRSDHRPTQSDATSSYSAPESISFGEQSPVSNISENEEEEIDLLNLTTSSSKDSQAIREKVSYSEQCDGKLLEHHDYAQKQKGYYLPHIVKDEPFAEENQGGCVSCDAPHHWSSCSLSPVPPWQMVGVPAPDSTSRPLVATGGHEDRSTQSEVTSLNRSFQINVKDELPERSLSPRFAVSYSGKLMWTSELLSQQCEQRDPSFPPVLTLDLSPTRTPTVQMTSAHVRDNTDIDRPDPSIDLSPPPDVMLSMYYPVSATPDRLDVYSPVPTPPIGEVMHDFASVVLAGIPSAHDQHSLAGAPDRLNVYNSVPAPSIGVVMPNFGSIEPAAGLLSAHHHHPLAGGPDRLNLYNPPPLIGEVMHDFGSAGLPSTHNRYPLAGAPPDGLNVYSPQSAPSIGELLRSRGTLGPVWVPSALHHFPLPAAPDRLNTYDASFSNIFQPLVDLDVARRLGVSPWCASVALPNVRLSYLMAAGGQWNDAAQRVPPPQVALPCALPSADFQSGLGTPPWRPWS